MINVSKAFKLLLTNDKRNYKLKLKITLADNTVLPDITEKDIWASSFKISDATSGMSSFDVGSAIINKLNFAINNIYNTYSTYDFNGAKAVCQVGLTLPDTTTEYINKGKFTVYEQPSYNGSLISFICYDNMYRFDKLIASISGITNVEVVANICIAVGVILNTSQFDGYDLPFTMPTNITKMTYRQLLSYICMLTGNFARINVDGTLEIKWYDTDFYNSEIHLDGGTFKTTTTPYSDGDNADGGNFTDYTSGDNIDGGTFTALGSFHHLYSLSSQSFSTDDVIITGIKIIDSDQVEYIIGTSDYMISIENNPLVTAENLQTYLTFLGNKIIGMRFRKFSVSCLSDPTIEAGDNAKISDNKGNVYLSFINSNVFTIGNYQSVSCNAESPLQNSSEKLSVETQNLVNSRKVADKQISTYDLYVQQLTTLIANGYGMFPTPVIDENGGVITYLHDKPVMDESSVRWFTNSEGMVEENRVNGVWVLVSGTDKYGNALYKVLTARRIIADLIQGGTLTLGGNNNGNGIFSLLNANGVPLITMTKDGFVLDFVDSYGETKIIMGSTGLTAQQKTAESGGFVTLFHIGVLVNSMSGAKGTWCGTLLPSVIGDVKSQDYWNFSTGDVEIGRNFHVNGIKSRIIKTKNYNKVLQYCIESTSPMFEDMGNATLDNGGLCYIDIESVFSETVDLNTDYYIQLTKYGQGELWVDEINQDYFIIKGTPNLKFSWSLKVKQLGYSNERLDQFDTVEETNNDDIDYEYLAIQYLEEYEKEIIE